MKGNFFKNSYLFEHGYERTIKNYYSVIKGRRQTPSIRIWPLWDWAETYKIVMDKKDPYGYMQKRYNNQDDIKEDQA